MRLLLLLILALGWTGAASARWFVAESPSFAVYAQSPDAASAAAARLEAFDGLLRRLTGVATGPLPVRLDVYLVQDAEALRSIGIAAPGASGVYFARPLVLAAVVAQAEAARAGTPTAVLFHEYAHHFMYQYGGASYPPWYTEGFAEYVMTARLEGGRAEWGLHDPGRVMALRRGSWIPVTKILRANGAAVASGRLTMFYPQAWLMVHFMNRDPAARLGLARYMAALRQGGNAVAAFEPAFGMPPEAFDRRLRAYFTGGEMTYNRAAWDFAANSVAARPLPPAADRLLLPRLHIALGAAPPVRDALLDSVRTEAARWPADRYAVLANAEAEAVLGDPATALREVAQLAPDPVDAARLALVRGLALRALALAGAPELRAARMTSASAALAEGEEAAPRDYRLLFLRVLCAPLPLSENDFARLEQARTLAPQVAEIGLAAAYALQVRGDFAGARQILLLIANDLHGGGLSEAAARILSSLPQ